MYISGTDIPILYGLGSISPYELWLLKKGEATISETFQMRMGKRLEPIIREVYQNAISYPKDGWLSCASPLTDFISQGKPLWINDKSHFIPHSLGFEINHSDYPFFKGHLDDYHEKGIVAEFKSTRDYIISCPLKYQLQTAFYCILTEAHEGNIAVLHNTVDFSLFTYKRNKTVESLILEKAIQFYENHLKADIPPPSINLKDIKRQNEKIYQHLNQNPLIVNQDICKKLESYYLLHQELKEKETHLKALKIELLKEFQDHELIMDEYGNQVASYKFNKTATPNIDKKMLQSQYPEIWEKVKIDRTPSRIFRVKN